MHVHGRGILRAAAAFLAAAAILAIRFPAGARGEEERPRIFLEKKVFAETSDGKRSFYEIHAVEEGESLWKILSRNPGFAAQDYGLVLREFRRINPDVSDPDRLRPGQAIAVPSVPMRPTDPRVASGQAVPYKVAPGDALTKILAGRGVSRREMRDRIADVLALNDSIRDADLIYAGRTILLPAGKPPAKGTAEAPGEEIASARAPGRDVPESPAAAGMPSAKPDARILEPPAGRSFARDGGSGSPAPGDNAVAGETSPGTAGPSPFPAPKPPYRGLLADIVKGLGETWTDRGILYLPASSGDEVVLDIEEYPIVRLASGRHLMIDFRGSLSPRVRSLISETWDGYSVVSMADAAGAGEMIDRLLRGAGYHSVTSRSIEIGEPGRNVWVVLPAGWVVLRGEESLLRGELILVKEVPEKPGPDLSAVLRFAARAGVRVLPYAVDPAAREGFLVALDGEARDADPPPRVLPREGIEAFDFALDYLGVPKVPGEPLSLAGPGGSFRMTVEPERIFDAGGKRYLVYGGTMAPALRSLVRESGYSVFPVGRDEPGISLFRRIQAALGLAGQDRRETLLAGGAEDGFEIRATGLFLTQPEWLGKRGLRAAGLVRGSIPPETRALLRDIRVEIVGWSS